MAQRSDGPHTPPPPLVIEDDFNHYEVLGVEPLPTPPSSRRHAPRRQQHPDSRGHRRRSCACSARTRCCDASSRRSYDATLVELRRRRLLFTPGSNELLPHSRHAGAGRVGTASAGARSSGCRRCAGCTHRVRDKNSRRRGCRTRRGGAPTGARRRLYLLHAVGRYAAARRGGRARRRIRVRAGPAPLHRCSTRASAPTAASSRRGPTPSSAPTARWRNCRTRLRRRSRRRRYPRGGRGVRRAAASRPRGATPRTLKLLALETRSSSAQRAAPSR